MPDLTPIELQHIIAELSQGKAAAELEALEFRARYATAAQEAEELRADLAAARAQLDEAHAEQEAARG